MNIQSHFAKYIEQPIWNCLTEQTVTLKAVRSNTLLFMNGNPEEQEGAIIDFRIIVADDVEVIKNGIPPELAVIQVEKTLVRKAFEITPSVVLEKLKDILYPPLAITHQDMIDTMDYRGREFVITRQIIMAVYFCVFEHSKYFKVTLSNAGKIYGKDHATVIHAIKKINGFLDIDRNFFETYKEVWEFAKKVNPRSQLHI